LAHRFLASSLLLFFLDSALEWEGYIRGWWYLGAIEVNICVEKDGLWFFGCDVLFFQEAESQVSTCEDNDYAEGLWRCIYANEVVAMQ